MRETSVRSLCRECPVEKEMANHSSILAWRIPRTEEPGWLQSMGLQRVRHDWASSLHFNYGRVLWQPIPVFLPGEAHGQRSLVGYSPWGHKESDDWATKTQYIMYSFTKYFIYLFLTVLGLCCWGGFSSSCGELGLISSCGLQPLEGVGFSSCGSWILERSVSNWGTWA